MQLLNRFCQIVAVLLLLTPRVPRLLCISEDSGEDASSIYIHLSAPTKLLLLSEGFEIILILVPSTQ